MQTIDDFLVTECGHGEYSAFASDLGWSVWPERVLFKNTTLSRQRHNYRSCDSYVDDYLSDDGTVRLTVFDD